MSAFEELVERCARKICETRGKKPDDPRWVRYPGPTVEGKAWHEHIGDARAALAESFRTLENVTPEMIAYQLRRGLPETWARRDYLAALRASPLAAPAEKETEG